jgi:hypothetical protein
MPLLKIILPCSDVGSPIAKMHASFSMFFILQNRASVHISIFVFDDLGCSQLS